MEINNLTPRYKNHLKKEWLLFVQYPNNKHHIFIVVETERQLLKRIKSICRDTSDKIAYVDAYEIMNNGDNKIIYPYGEYNYKFKDEPNTNGEIKISMPLKYWNKIADACIKVADYGIITDSVKASLRKTYYQIKAETR